MNHFPRRARDTLLSPVRAGRTSAGQRSCQREYGTDHNASEEEGKSGSVPCHSPKARVHSSLTESTQRPRLSDMGHVSHNHRISRAAGPPPSLRSRVPQRVGPRFSRATNAWRRSSMRDSGLPRRRVGTVRGTTPDGLAELRFTAMLLPPSRCSLATRLPEHVGGPLARATPPFCSGPTRICRYIRLPGGL
jgi:hypothetical protein